MISRLPPARPGAAPDLNTLAARARAGGAAKDEALREISRQFAGLFLGQMMKAMRRGVPTTGIGHGGAGERLFQDLADEQIALAAARRDAGGISEILYRSLAPRAPLKISAAPAASTAPETP